ncbi:MAG: DUF1553 domain-containing protein [Planctomycetota bacterium]
MIRVSVLCLLACVVACSSPALAQSSTDRPAAIDFQKIIRPILAEHCWHCHGVDEAQRQGGLRLDSREAALAGGESRQPAIVPGQPDSSELLKRILSHDPDTVMPPSDQPKQLTAAAIEALRHWIAEGAPFQDHWAFTAPKKTPLPAPAFTNPIDSFVSHRLQREGLRFSPAAPPEQLARRLYLDLIGIPPTPDQLQQFITAGPVATAQMLLDSPRYGEKWARHWLDLARYSDTNGYEKDLQREQWIWRDWVIDAISSDMPYDQFIIEQVAGDLLPNATQSQRIATGFLRNSMINEEGAIVPEQFRMVEMFDRMDCIGKAVLGLTTQCAQCHSHKFDPLTHNEYYGLFAFLNDTYESQSWVYSPEQQQKLTEISTRATEIRSRMQAARPQWNEELQTFCSELTFRQPVWTPLQFIEMGSNSGLNHPTQEADQSILMKGHTSGDVFVIATPPAAPITAPLTGLQIEVLNHRDLPQNGPGRSRLGTWMIHELEVFLRKPGSDAWEKQPLSEATADFSSPESKSGDGKKTTGPVQLLIDGSDDTSWLADRGPGFRNQPSVAVVRFTNPLELPEGSQLKIAWRMGDMPGCMRFSLTATPTPSAPAVSHAAMLALQLPADQRTADEQLAVFDAWQRSVPELKPLSEELDQLIRTTPDGITTVLHVAARSPRDPRGTFRLDRGEWDQPRDPVQPHVPAAFHTFPADAPLNRLGFARWLVDPRSPLAARVAVNNIWQAIFGQGLVETSEDFGTRAPVPEYRELLDWLAVDFMEHGWSRRHLLQTIISSRTWQQSSVATPQLLERDPRNQLLARGARYRADAEVIRDIALTAAGLLSTRSKGPSVIPPVPQNVLDYNYTYPGYWTPATGEDRYRRAVYLFRKRSMPDPVLASFDAPNGDFSCPRRMRSNTPMAALAGLNETIFIEAARALALRILKEAPPDDAARAQHGFLLCTSRQPTHAELTEILQALQNRRQRIADGWLNPRELTTGDPAKLPELPPDTTPQDAAAWTLLARVLLNLDETITRN